MEPNLLKRLGQNDPLGSRFWGCGVERHTPKPSRLPAPCVGVLGLARRTSYDVLAHASHPKLRRSYARM